MEATIIESTYPIAFRKQYALFLGQYLKNRQSLILVGMKRVGISNFLRFFLYHKDIAQTYIADGKKHAFVAVDLNDLVEREIFPFWTLTLKRVVDCMNKTTLPANIKSEIDSLFLKSIQTQDLFFTIDCLRKVLQLLVEQNIVPTIFFLRFDRIKDVVTPAFFDNLLGLKDATSQNLSYVFTSYRTLHDLSPAVFQKASLSVFLREVYIKPAEKKDSEIILQTLKQRYSIALSAEIEKTLLQVVDGYVQYLQLSLIALHETALPKDSNELLSMLEKDERISLQSEELWESLTISEQDVLRKIAKDKHIDDIDIKKSQYLWQTGFVISDRHPIIFSPLFCKYILKKEKKPILRGKGSLEFTKKEHALFVLLQGQLGQVCERETIIEAVWSEIEEIGVSDWAIDRLVARLRSKLKAQESNYEIQTIKTRGYKLVGSSRE